MASYHCTVKVGAKGSGGTHSEYISREGKYSKENSRKYEDLISTGSGNMPEWAQDYPAQFWHSADQYERANGAVYREIEIALPRELTDEQNKELVLDFIAQEIGDRHAFQWAIHKPKAALEKGDQPHAHIMYSERTIDGIQRDPDQYFKRYNSKHPEKGGCRKDSAGTEERLQATRELWANVQNIHLEKYGHPDRVTHLSLKDQGIDRQPEKHIGPKKIRHLSQEDISNLLERRQAEGELERASQEVGLIDLSGNIEKAKQEKAEIKEVIASGVDDFMSQFMAHQNIEKARQEAEHKARLEHEKRLAQEHQKREVEKPQKPLNDWEKARQAVQKEKAQQSKQLGRDEDFGMSL